MYQKTVAELSRMLHNREVTSYELTQQYIDRIKQFDSKLNSFITLTEERALADAKLADEKLDTGQGGPLTGIPIAHKDIFCTQGIKTSCGSRMLDNFTAPYESTVTALLAEAGTVMIGKTNMDEFAMGSSNENSYYGPVANPWDTGRVPGGSTGGSAAAVAAGLSPLASGTDTGGSIRQPAALCGVSGMKPTYGRVSRYGMIAFASSLDQAGPIGRSAECLAYMLNGMTKHDPKDSTSVEHPVPDYTSKLNNSIEGTTIGFPQEYFEMDMDPESKQRVEEAIEVLKSQGAAVKPISLPHTKVALSAYYIIAPAEASSNLARYDGVRYGYRCDNPQSLEDLYKRTRSEGFGDEVKRRIMTGTYALSAGYYDAYYLKAQKIRRLISKDFQNAFSEVDVIAAPTAPTPAFKLDEKTKDPVSMYLSDVFTIPVNMAGLPALSVPCGFVQGLPVGLQLMGNYFEEANILNVAHQYQQQTQWHQQFPEGYQL